MKTVVKSVESFSPLPQSELTGWIRKISGSWGKSVGIKLLPGEIRFTIGSKDIGTTPLTSERAQIIFDAAVDIQRESGGHVTYTEGPNRASEFKVSELGQTRRP